MKRGTIVRYWFDTGADGHQHIYGVVSASGPTTFTVTWESGLKNRRKHGDTRVAEVTDPELLAEGRTILARRGIIPQATPCAKAR